MELRKGLTILKGPWNAIEMPTQRNMFRLCADNMRKMYDDSNFNGIGWSNREKKSEFRHPRAQYLVALEHGELCAFAHFRFENEMNEECLDNLDVVYLYELQVATSTQGQGWGTFLMSNVENEARQRSMKKIMCTVLRVNRKAMNFYINKCGFSEDGSTPDGREYVILSKFIFP